MKRGLVVDDADENLLYLSAVLRAHGWEVDLAHNGVEALAKANVMRPDLVISDLLMPVMDGFKLLRQWKADPALRTVPFAIYTATYTEQEDEDLARSLGADDFILKPAEPEQLIVRLEAVYARGGRAGEPVPEPPVGETEVLRQYSEVLVRKLEAKMLQLEDTNRALQGDIAARRRVEASLSESEANLREIVETIPQLVLISRSDGANEFCNQRWCDYTGLTREASLGDGWLAAIHPLDRDAVRAAWRRALATGDAFAVEARLQDGNGTERHWLVRSVPVRVEGAVSKWFGTWTDIDELRQTVARLQRTEGQLRQAQKMEAFGQLAAGVAHDFNNLLTVILSYTSFIINGLPAADALRADLEQIRNAGERAAALTRQLLLFGRQQAIVPRAIQLQKVIGELERMLQQLLPETVQLSITAAPDLGVVLLDPTNAEQVLLNLVVNARDAMPDGGRISVELTNATLDAEYAASHHGVSPGRFVMLAVHDTGHGMDAATRARIFEPFFTTKPVGKGTGLGLATVYAIVTQNGGHLTVDSEPGAGSVFRIFFPYLAAPGTDAVDAANASGLRGTETILVVEAAEEVRTVARTVLRGAGYTVLEAASPADALAASARHPGLIHLLLTDLIMPRMTGRQLADRLRSARAEIKVLYTSAYTAEAAIHHGMVDPGASLVLKPIRADALLAALRDVLDAVTPPISDPAVAPAARPPSLAPERGLHVLHVDDEDALVELTMRVLKQLGYRVSGFTDPLAALTAFEAHPDAIDAVVTDISMPAMTGFELVRRIRQRRPDIPVVVTTGYVRSEDQRDADALGLRTPLVKPHTINELGLALHDEIRCAGAKGRAPNR